MDENKLNLSFKGQRPYIHGTSILDEVMACALGLYGPELVEVDFSIHKMVDKKLFVRWFSSDASVLDKQESIAQIKFKNKDNYINGGIFSESESPSERVPYFESLVTDFCSIDIGRRKIALERDDSGFSGIEILVAMNKALHLAVFENLVDIQWVFCRWSGPVWPLPDDMKGVAITLKKNLGTRLTCAEVILRGRVMGNLYFSGK